MPISFRFALAVTLFGACAALLPAALQDKREAAKSDEERLQGTWNYAVAEVDGRPPIRKKLTALQKKKGFPSQSITFQGNKFEIKWDDTIIQAGTYKLDPSKAPKTIDIAVTEGDGKGAVQFGIYELKGHVFSVCYDPKGTKRPTELKAPFGSGLVLAIMQRELEPGVDPLDASVVYDKIKRMNSGFMNHNGIAYDKSALLLEPKSKLVLPDQATVVGRHDKGDAILIYMSKRAQTGFQLRRAASVLDYRDKMGCAVKLEKGDLLIGTYGEFSFFEGNVSMSLLVLLPPNVEVERRAGLVGGYGGRGGGDRLKDAINPARDDPKPALTKTKQGTPDVWLPPTIEDGWHAIPAVPDVGRRASNGAKGTVK
jgi:uncharacterized protein (TIGR03067 family)